MRLRPSIALAILLALDSAAQSQTPEPSSREQLFVSRYLDTCVETKYDYDAITAIAVANNWTETDFTAAPFKVNDKSGKAAPKMTAWKTDATPDAFIVYAVKFGNPKIRNECGIAGFELERMKIVDLLIADGRFKSANFLPVFKDLTMLQFEGRMFVVQQGNPPPEAKAAGHTSETAIQPF